MIENSLKKEGIEEDSYRIVGIPDVCDDKKWIESILEKVRFDIIFTKYPWTKRCFDTFKIAVEEHFMFGSITGSKTRENIEKVK